MFSTILCDAPWQFKVWSKDTGSGRSAESHYPTLDIPALKALPVADIAAPDCALFFWACMPMLPEALEVMEAWGFKYKTAAFTWMKTNPKGSGLFTGMGYWTRANAEICLLGTRGKPKRVDRGVKQAILAPVTRHSAKPPEIRERIERLMGPGPKIELFARERVPGWAALGNELDGRDIRESLPALIESIRKAREPLCRPYHEGEKAA